MLSQSRRIKRFSVGAESTAFSPLRWRCSYCCIGYCSIHIRDDADGQGALRSNKCIERTAGKPCLPVRFGLRPSPAAHAQRSAADSMGNSMCFCVAVFIDIFPHGGADRHADILMRKPVIPNIWRPTTLKNQLCCDVGC